MNLIRQIKQLAQHYGFRHQGLKLSEEAAELSAAMTRLVNGEGGRLAVVEEIADTLILIQQMRYLMDIRSGELRDMMEAKLARQQMRIDKSEKTAIIKNYTEAEKNIAWYQELYDKARRAQVAAAEDADALRQENERLRQELHKAQCGA